MQSSCWANNCTCFCFVRLFSKLFCYFLGNNLPNMKNKHVKRINLLLSILFGSRCLHFSSEYTTPTICIIRNSSRCFSLHPTILSNKYPIPGEWRTIWEAFSPNSIIIRGRERYLDRCNRGYSQVDGLDCKPPGRTPGMVSAYSATFFMFLYSVLRRKFSFFPEPSLWEWCLGCTLVE